MEQQKKLEMVKKLTIDTLKQVKREGIEDLLAYLEKSDYYTSPASSRYHNSYPGGLAEHSLSVYNALVFHYENLKDSDYDIPKLSEESLIIVGILHDLCKINTYHPTYRNQKVYSENGSKQDAGGKFDWEVVESYERKPLFAMGHGAKSVFIIQQFMNLTPEEAQAIYWHMGAYDISPYMTLNELSQAWNENLLAFLLHQADMTCTYITENELYQKE